MNSEKVEVIITTLCQKIHDYRAFFNKTPKAIYVGRDEYLTLANAMSNNYFFTAVSMVDGERKTFNGIPVYKVDEENHIDIS